MSMTPSDYSNLYASCRLTDDPRKLKELDSVCRVALANQCFYSTVEKFVSIPWPVIAAIHFRESGQNFKCHLHNGDPLSARTVHIPAGRPAKGAPPFTWIDSACNALTGRVQPPAWDLAGCLEFMEYYNGGGYQKRGVNTPYLWDYTDAYTSGLFVADGTFDPTKKESRPGAAAILKTLEAKGVSLDFTALVAVSPGVH